MQKYCNNCGIHKYSNSRGTRWNCDVTMNHNMQIIIIISFSVLSQPNPTHSNPQSLIQTDWGKNAFWCCAAAPAAAPFCGIRGRGSGLREEGSEEGYNNKQRDNLPRSFLASNDDDDDTTPRMHFIFRRRSSRILVFGMPLLLFIPSLCSCVCDLWPEHFNISVHPPTYPN